MFGAPFLLLLGVYDALPAQLPVFRFALAGGTIVAAKSFFTVFRVPLMNVTHGSMAAIMLAHTADFEDVKQRASYSALFSTLLFTVALKSNFEAVEFGSLAQPLSLFRNWATAGTVVSVVGGLILAFFRSRRTPIPWRELRLSTRDKILLAAFFALYFLILAQSLLIGHRA